MDNINHELYKSSSRDFLNHYFNEACENGEFEKVKYLTTSPKLLRHADVYNLEYEGFIRACRNGHVDIVKFLLTSQDLKLHVDINARNGVPFSLVSDRKTENVEILDFFINELKISKDLEYMEIYPKSLATKMFKMRDLDEELKNGLSSNQDLKKKKLKL